MVSRKMLDAEASQEKVVKEAKNTGLPRDFAKGILTVEKKTGDNAR